MGSSEKVFVTELVSLTGVSKQYAESAWFTLGSKTQKSPKEAAYRYARRWGLLLN